MVVLLEAARWGSCAMENTLGGVPEVKLERYSPGVWHFSGAPEIACYFNISTAPRLVWTGIWPDQWWRNWCHLGEGEVLMSKWQVSKIAKEQEDVDEFILEEQEGQQEQEEEDLEE